MNVYIQLLIILFISILILLIINEDFLPSKLKLKFYDLIIPFIKQKNINKYESTGEKICRQVLEDYFNQKFDNSRPIWLINPKTGKKLELDCYNPYLNIAVEYNGIQHYKYAPTFHKNEKQFKNQIYRDKIKNILCDKYGVTLITVPYTIKHNDIKNYIIDKLNNC